MEIITLEQFYKQIAAGGFEEDGPGYLLPDGITREIGHFNVFRNADLVARVTDGKQKPVMAYNRRSYYKISLIRAASTAEYADKVIEIEKNALLFASPKVPYNYTPRGTNEAGYFCVFTDEFMVQTKTGVAIDELPIFKAGGYPIFPLEPHEVKELDVVFKKMYKELSSDYVFKYDLLRNYVMELIHYGQKLQPATALYPMHNASARVSSLFIELLERQFPIESVNQRLSLRTAKDYADRLAIHVNHLNKVLKENTGKTTTELISSRISQEAKILLRQTDWNVSEIAYSLGFEEVAHFSNFFRKHAAVSPLAFRNRLAKA